MTFYEFKDISSARSCTCRAVGSLRSSGRWCHGSLPGGLSRLQLSSAPQVGAEAPSHALSGFLGRLCSPLVTLEGRLSARRSGVHEKGAGLGCVLFGDGPVPNFPQGRYFEVCASTSLDLTQLLSRIDSRGRRRRRGHRGLRRRAQPRGGPQAAACAS